MKRRRRAKQKTNAQKAKLRAAAQLLLQYDLSGYTDRAERLERRFILHVGETNSGKTYQALQALQSAPSGVYLGPLRLLALEVFDTLNLAGCPCSLLTGEESEQIPFSRHTASTVEMCDFSQHYDVAVIDEAQMVADPYRGAAWTRAILGIDADEVHVCLAPEAQGILHSILVRTHTSFRTVHHKRLARLVFSGAAKGLASVEPGDALITFSRKEVLSTAAALEQRGVSASVIYGALPPASRREEVRKFAQGETTVVVATDAIGMGVSLPIRRIIFCQSMKFDGVSRRDLTVSEIKQIAGRAGRYGMYDVGEVLTMSDPELIASALESRPPKITSLTLPFPAEALESEFDIPTLIRAWESLPVMRRTSRESLSEALFLYRALAPVLTGPQDKQAVFRCVGCPVDVGNRELVGYWRDCAAALLQGRAVPPVPFGTETLEDCELRFKALDVRRQMLRRAGIEESVSAEQAALSGQINRFLRADKSGFLRRCARCHSVLPFNHSHRLCEKCWQRYCEARSAERNGYK